MTSTDSCGSCSSSFNGRTERGNVVYNNSHHVDIQFNNGTCAQINISFVVLSLDNAIKLKVRDTSVYSFNYTTLIDWLVFDRIKKEQSLDIAFDEFQPQIIELLNQTVLKKMQMRIEADDSKCRIIFYEKSRIKSLIFLTIDLGLTNQKELIDEMSDSITQLKEYNKNISTQLSLSKNQQRDTELLLKDALNKKSLIEKQFHKDLELILQTFVSHLSQTEANISLEIAKLTKRHQKLLKDLELVKRENILKCESNSHLIQSMANLRLENDRNNRAVAELQTELERLRINKTDLEQRCSQMRSNMSSKDEEIKCLQVQLGELRRDIQDATMIIAQKTKTNEEIGKDLMEANRLLVNFNLQNDILLNENEQLKERLSCKDDIIRGQVLDLEKANMEFQNYRTVYNAEDVNNLQHELFLARRKMEDLEKQNKDAVKLNGLLTKKLSNGEVVDVRNQNLLPPK